MKVVLTNKYEEKRASKNYSKKDVSSTLETK